jgi:circadian clock protein KaiB
MTSASAVLHLRLYVAGTAPNSARAQENLAALCQGLTPDQMTLEIVDVLREPLRALQDKVFVTPVLRRLAPLPEVQIIGDLSDVGRVRQALGLGEVER